MWTYFLFQNPFWNTQHKFPLLSGRFCLKMFISEHLHLSCRAGILGRAGRKNQFLDLTAMSHKMLILKSGIDFFLGSSPPPPSENQFNNGIDAHKEPIPGAHKSLNINTKGNIKHEGKKSRRHTLHIKISIFNYNRRHSDDIVINKFI